jgi:nucleoside 2-deoxyribosyltransferase
VTPRIYLAGDLVFRPDALAIFDRLRAICASLNLAGIAPLDGQADLAGLPPGPETILAIVKADRALMDSCAAGLFCLDPFRGAPDMEPGTAVEIGYMHAQAKPLCGYTTDGRDYPTKVAARHKLRPRAPLALGGSSGSLEDENGILVHSEGMVQNGMTEGFIRLSGGLVFADPDFDTAFLLAATHLAGMLK